MRTRIDFCLCLCIIAVLAATCAASVRLGSIKWYESREGDNLKGWGSGGVKWFPEGDRTVYVDLGSQYSMKEVGDSVTFSCMWSSSGETLSECERHGCEEEDECDFDDDVRCLAGTGDFRLGLFDSNGRGIVASDGFEDCGENPMFRGYLGYNWRFHPHICQGKRFRQESGEPHTNVSCWKRDDPWLDDYCGANLIGDCGGVCDRPTDPRPCSRDFGPVRACPDLELGESAVFEVKMERTAEGIKNSFFFNGRSFSYTDDESSFQPEIIDVFAIHFSNARPYDYVIFDSVSIEGTEIAGKAVRRSPPDTVKSPGGAYSEKLVLYWLFDEGRGSTLHDRSGGGNDGDTENMEDSDWDDKFGRKCLSFNGDDEYIRLEDDRLSEPLSGDFTACCWVRFEDTGTNDRIFDMAQGSNDGLQIAVNSDGGIRIDDSGGVDDEISSSSDDLNDQWHHIAVVRSGSRLTLYIDGKRENSGSSSVSTYSGLFAASDSGGGSNMDGRLDDLRIYSCALNESEIAGVMKIK